MGAERVAAPAMIGASRIISPALCHTHRRKGGRLHEADTPKDSHPSGSYLPGPRLTGWVVRP